MAPSAPKLTKDELRAHVEKLERANTNLRAKNREAGREAKTVAARIAELEAQVAQLEKQLAARAARAGGAGTAPAREGRRTRHREIDPGDSVPPGVAVEEPAPLDLEAEIARENLEDHLGHEERLDLEAELDLEVETAQQIVGEHQADEALFDLEVDTARETLGEHMGGE